MKKTLLYSLGFALLLFSQNLLSQNRDLYLGFEGGIGIRSFTGNFDERRMGLVTSDQGYTAGVSLQYFISDEFSIKTSLLFEQKGAKTQWEKFDQNGNLQFTSSLRLNFSYLSFPMLFRYSFGKKRRFFANIGPYLGVLLDHPYTIIHPGRDYFDTTRKLDFGLSSGLGARFPINKKLIFSAEIRNNLGAYNINAFPFLDSSRGAVQTRSTNIMMGFVFLMK